MVVVNDAEEKNATASFSPQRQESPPSLTFEERLEVTPHQNITTNTAAHINSDSEKLELAKN